MTIQRVFAAIAIASSIVASVIAPAGATTFFASKPKAQSAPLGPGYSSWENIQAPNPATWASTPMARQTTCTGIAAPATTGGPVSQTCTTSSLSQNSMLANLAKLSNDAQKLQYMYGSAMMMEGEVSSLAGLQFSSWPGLISALGTVSSTAQSVPQQFDSFGQQVATIFFNGEQQSVANQANTEAALGNVSGATGAAEMTAAEMSELAAQAQQKAMLGGAILVEAKAAPFTALSGMQGLFGLNTPGNSGLQNI